MSEKERKKVNIPANITIREFAQLIEVSPIQIIKKLMANGVMASINEAIDYDTASILADEMGFDTTLESQKAPIEKETGAVPLWRKTIAEENAASLSPRPPVVTILGHVDHGKTTLLDAIRNADVASGEAGGITQHIGAYQVELKGRMITFLDTPGHAAFTAMRSRGAQGADIVILVIAADDGVMPQTKEAIAHAKAARVPIVVALNKVDKPNANIDRVKKQLVENDLMPDDWGGSTMVIPVSAKQKQGIEDLLEAALLVADNIDIRANPKGEVIGTVIEAELDKSKGPVATLLVQNGTLNTGDIVVAGNIYGRLRALFDFRGRKIQKAGPSIPVSVMGLSSLPSAGDVFKVVNSEKEARQLIVDLEEINTKQPLTAKKITLEELFSKIKAGEAQELNLILKADVQGSLEPIINEINNLGKGEIKINILYAETGNISENDVLLASSSQAIIVGFSVQADVAARRLADTEGVSIRLYDIIYRLIEDVEKALKGMLAPEFSEKAVGKAVVLQVFGLSKGNKIAGCRVTEGEIRRNGKLRVTRGKDIVYEGEVSSLKHEKEDVREMRTGFECGIGLKNFNDIQIGDVIDCFILEKTVTG
jgi:translation initiation factor IF-2